MIDLHVRRYKYRDLDSAKTWIEAESRVSVHHFSELHLIGGGQLAIMPVTDSWNAVEVMIGQLLGDNSGTLHVGFNQSFQVEVTNPDVPFNLRVYEKGAIDLPRRAFLHHASFYSSGKVQSTILCLLSTDKHIFKIMMSLAPWFSINMKFFL